MGAGREKEAKSVTWQGLQFVGIFGTAIGLIGIGLSFPLPALLGAEGSLQQEAGLYFRIIACAMP